MPSETSEQRAARKAAEAKAKAIAAAAALAPAPAEPWLSRSTFPRLFLLLTKLWLIVALGAQAMVFTTWVLIMLQDTHRFKKQLGGYMGNDGRRYGLDLTAGYVANTNIPKHLAGPVFSFLFDVSMMLFIVISTAADFYCKVGLAKQILEAFWTDGLWDESGETVVEYFFLIANAFLKLFIVTATGAQSYLGLQPHSPQLDTPLFCLYSVFILLGSIPITIIADMFIIQHDRWVKANK